MLRWAAASFLIATVAAVLGFFTQLGMPAWVMAKILFVISLILAAASPFFWKKR